MFIKRWIMVGLLTMICYSALGKPILNIQSWTTDKGTQVLFVPTHELPMLDIQITFDAGSSRDDQYPGMAQFTGMMLKEGTKTLTADQIAAEFDKNGALFGVATNPDMTTIGLRTLTDQKILNQSLQIFTQIITEPSFPQVAFNRVQRQLISGIKQEEEQPGRIAYKAFYKTLYENHPYSHPVLGTQKTIQQLTPQNLQTFYKKYYIAKNAVVSIVGDISTQQAKNIIHQIFSPLPEGKQPNKISPFSKRPEKQFKHISFPSEQTHILIGQIGIDWHDPDFFPLLVGNYIFGQSPLTSQLFQEVRNKRGLTYSVGSSFIVLQNKGPFVIILQTQTEKAQEAIAITKRIMNRFVEQGITKKQLTASKKSLIGRFPLTLANNSQILSYLNTIGFYHLPLSYLDTYQNKIQAVTLKQVKEAFKRHIYPNNMITITVGIKKQITEN